MNGSQCPVRRLQSLNTSLHKASPHTQNCHTDIGVETWEVNPREAYEIMKVTRAASVLRRQIIHIEICL